MEVQMCDKFFYRVDDENEDLFQQLNTGKENVIRNNEKLKLYKGEWIYVKVNSFLSHIVKPAQTIKQIADIYKISVEKLKLDNNLQSEKLYIGQILKIYY